MSFKGHGGGGGGRSARCQRWTFLLFPPSLLSFLWGEEREMSAVDFSPLFPPSFFPFKTVCSSRYVAESGRWQSCDKGRERVCVLCTEGP